MQLAMHLLFFELFELFELFVSPLSWRDDNKRDERPRGGISG